jgi:hypothetical protein
VVLSSPEVAKCDAITLEIIKQDIGVELTEFYGAAVFFNDNVKPEQPNNEIRNALNHIARAYESQDWAEADDNIGAAKRHIERAKRDSLKLAIIGVFGQIRGIVSSADYYYGTIPPALMVRRADLAERRRMVYAMESAGSNDITTVMLGIFVDAKTLLDDLQNQFPAATPERKTKIFFLRLRRQAVAVLVGFVLGALASLSANFIWERVHAPQSKSKGNQTAPISNAADGNASGSHLDSD